ncbi:hypothetical protein [Methylobacterium brachiatum]|jgi:hypothetical protein|uniref:hypothetical protein n=1 Tax=Methylobacterium brachiatum TaxID=269660 RepID=UPI0024491E3F|nr:hypothetical protein [Methylobacterium brachiatum]MDH2309245.1 hypothetical protein [Methylobacterium brachiatum]
MATVWYKRAYDRADLDPETFEALPGAIPPGIYCEDEVAFRALLASAREKGVEVEPAFGGPCLGGLTVLVATPEQAAAFQAAPVSTAKEILAEERAFHALGSALVGRLVAGLSRSAQDAAEQQAALEAKAWRASKIWVTTAQVPHAREQASEPAGRVTRQQRRAAERAGRRA